MVGFCEIRAALAGAALFACLPWGAAAAAQTWTVPMPGIDRIEVAADGAPVVVDGIGGRHRVRLVGGRVVVQPAGPGLDLSAPPRALPDGVMAFGAGGLSAWLDAPTARYGHAVLGDGIEAGALTVGYPDGSRARLTLGPDAVFEDRTPRFADMDGDGDDEILVVKAYADAGGALALIDPGSPGGPGPRIVAEAAPIGTPNRWLNPVGAGDVDGDGRVEALAVVTPHIGGTLTAYEWRGGQLVVEHQLGGFSNHRIGAWELELSGLAELDGDGLGIPEAVVPDAARREMTVVRFAGSAPRIVRRTWPGGEIVHRLVIFDLDLDGVPELTFGTDRGTLVVWKPGL